MKRLLKIIIEFIGAFVAVAVIAFLLLVWRVASQPMTSTALTPYIEKIASGFVPGTHAEIFSTILVWDNQDRSIAFQGENVKLLDDKNSVIAEFPTMKFRLSVLGLLLGRFVPAEMSIERPQLWFVRHPDGNYSFGGSTMEGDEATSADNKLLYESFRKFADDVTRFGLLRELTVTQAVISVHDEGTRQDWATKIPEIYLRNTRGAIAGQAKIEVTQKEGVSLLEAQYFFGQKQKQHNVVLKFQEMNPSFLAGRHPRLKDVAMFELPLSGEVAIVADRDFNVLSTTADIKGGDGHLNAPDLWDKPRVVKSFSLKANYDQKAQKLAVSSVEADFGGPKLSFKMDAKKPEADKKTLLGKDYDMAFMMNIRLTDLPMNSYGDIWPKTIIPDARVWIASNLAGGTFKQGEVTLRGRFAWDDIENLVLDSGEGKISAVDGRVSYMEGMPPVEGVGAEATFDLNGMEVKVSGGGIGALKVQPSTIKITDFQKDTQNIEIPLKIMGPSRDVVKMLDQPALNFAKGFGLRQDDVEGRVEGVLTMRFPLLETLKLDDMEIKANAQIFDFAAKKLVPRIEISQGNLALNLDMKGFIIKGPAALNKVPLQVVWQENFSGTADPRSQGTVTGILGAEQWKQLGVEPLAKIKGTTSVTLQYVQPRNLAAQLSGEVDLRQAAVKIEDLTWEKEIGIPAFMKFAADLPQGKNIAVRTIDVQGQNVKVKGTATLDRNTLNPLSIDLSPMIVGRSNAKVHFTQTGDEKGDLRFSVEGESFDVSGLRGGNDPAKADPRTKDYQLTLGTLYTSEKGFITNLQVHARRDPLGWSEIQLHGLADGTVPLDLNLVPEGAGRVFSLTSNDFGKALKGMGFSDSVKGGEMEIRGRSIVTDPRVIDGNVRIVNFSVSDLPVLARLLNAVSPFGFADLITGETSFDRLKGNFRWQGDAIDLSKIRAAGSTFGINVDGHVDLNTGEANLHGTLVPFSFVNSILNAIPLLGDIITGGEGQGIIAASYTIKGSLENPDIGVNPVSLLTPGFVRNLFFNGGSDEGGKAEEAAPAE